MQARVGDRLIVEGRHVGVGRRSGQVVEVIGQPGDAHYRVRWEDGHETVMFPSTDCVVISAQQHREEGRAGQADAPMVVEVKLRFEEDETHTDARAELGTHIGTFTGWGQAEPG
jgi:hypothetical protein